MKRDWQRMRCWIKVRGRSEKIRDEKKKKERIRGKLVTMWLLFTACEEDILQVCLLFWKQSQTFKSLQRCRRELQMLVRPNRPIRISKGTTCFYLVPLVTKVSSTKNPYYRCGDVALKPNWHYSSSSVHVSCVLLKSEVKRGEIYISCFWNRTRLRYPST